MNEWIVPIIASLAVPFFTFLAIAWKLSGRIATSEASELWEEARLLREDYRKRIEECEGNVRRLRNELQNCIEHNAALRREVQDD